VRLKCGPPTFIEERQEKVIEAHSRKRKRHHSTHYFIEIIEEWTYNRGPHQLIHILRFRHGRLVHIDTAGYGS
jgi:hypothetical protein